MEREVQNSSFLGVADGAGLRITIGTPLAGNLVEAYILDDCSG